jgi:pimeloyl-ACP methyl ester carboxylesterase
MSYIKLNYRKYGSGRPLIILHGLFGSLVNWETICENLSRYMEVYALDLRNHGDSPHGARFDFSIMAEDLKGFLEHHKLPEVLLLGHSLGGSVAMTFAAVYPEWVARLIVVDIAPKSYPPAMEGIIEAMMSLDLRCFSTLKEVVEALAPDIPDLMTRYFLVKNLTTDQKNGYHWKVNLGVIHDNYLELNKGLPKHIRFIKPTLFIRGALSDYIEAKDFARIKTCFPRAHIRTIPESGHWVHIDAPEDFTEAILEFTLE